MVEDVCEWNDEMASCKVEEEEEEDERGEDVPRVEVRSDGEETRTRFRRRVNESYSLSTSNESINCGNVQKRLWTRLRRIGSKRATPQIVGRRIRATARNAWARFVTPTFAPKSTKRL